MVSVCSSADRKPRVRGYILLVGLCSGYLLSYKPVETIVVDRNVGGFVRGGDDLDIFGIAGSRRASVPGGRSAGTVATDCASKQFLLLLGKVVFPATVL
jgi:hypothetical protein